MERSAASDLEGENEGRQRRAAIVQSSARSANEQTKDLHEGSAFTEYACECAQETCQVLLPLSVDEYEEIRKTPTWFVVASGHVVDGVETVVSETPRYWVVEKLGVAAMIAERLDPRSTRGRRRDPRPSELGESTASDRG